MARKIEVQIVGDASSLSRAFGQANRSASGFGSTLGHVGKMAGLALGAGALGGIALTLKAGYDEWKQNALVAAQTGAVLKSTGGAAHVTAGQVDALASSLLKKSGIDDEVIQSGENMLLTFRNIRNEVGAGNDIFNQATKATLDLSVAMGKDMTSSSILVGKALNDPILGLGALRRVGVQFTDDQKTMIKGMVEAGDTMGAQKIIIGELTKEFGGSAEAMGKTLPGQIAILKESFNNLAGEIFTKLVPTLTSVVTWVTTHWPEISAVMGAVFQAIGNAIQATRPVFEKLIEWGKLAVGYVKDHWPEISATVTRVMETVRSIITQVVTAAEAIWSRFGAAITAIASTAFTAAVAVIRNAFNIIAGLFLLVGDLIHGRWGKVWDDVKQIVSNAAQAVVTILGALVSMAAQLASAVGHAIVDGIMSGLAGLKQKVTDALHYSLLDAVKDAGGALTGSGDFMFTKHMVGEPMAQGVIEGWVSGLAPLPDKMKDSVKAAIEAARTQISNSRSVLQTAWSEVAGDASAAFSSIANAIKTPGEKILAAFDAKQATAQLKRDLADAQTAYTGALQDQNASDADKAAAKQRVMDLLNGMVRTGLEQQALDERTQADARTAYQQAHFATDLENLQKHLAAGHTSYATAQEKILDLFKSYHVNFEAAASN